MDGLKPCPFCGNEAKLMKPSRLTPLNRTVKRPSCTKCGATMFVWKSTDDAIKEWNKRI